MSHLLTRMLAVVAMSLAAACSSSSVLSDAEAVQRRTVPPGGSTTAIDTSRGAGGSFRFTWSVRSGWSWERYSEWLSATMTPDYVRGSGGPARLTLTRRVDGDVYRLDARLDATETGMTTVRVTLTAGPD